MEESSFKQTYILSEKFSRILANAVLSMEMAGYSKSAILYSMIDAAMVAYFGEMDTVESMENTITLLRDQIDIKLKILSEISAK